MKFFLVHAKAELCSQFDEILFNPQCVMHMDGLLNFTIWKNKMKEVSALFSVDIDKLLGTIVTDFRNKQKDDRFLK